MDFYLFYHLIVVQHYQKKSKKKKIFIYINEQIKGLNENETHIPDKDQEEKVKDIKKNIKETKETSKAGNI